MYFKNIINNKLYQGNNDSYSDEKGNLNNSNNSFIKIMLNCNIIISKKKIINIMKDSYINKVNCNEVKYILK